MEFELKTGPQGHVYLPKRIRKILGENMVLIPNSTVVVVYPNGADLKAVMRSLGVILSDLKLRASK